MKFSVIVPVYNVEKYLEKCIDSIINQTYKDFELLIINDGTKDNSQVIIDRYVKEYPSVVKGYIKENGGLSDARNYGVRFAKGEYIVFVDSDDYVGQDLLEKLNDEIVHTPGVEVIGYNFFNVDKEYNILDSVNKPAFSGLTGEEAINTIISSKVFFEPAWSFAYNRMFWNDNSFMYAKGRYHEDIGLTPLVIAKAKIVSSINYVGYYYYQSDNSIIRNTSKEKEKKKAYDLLVHFYYLKNELEKTNISEYTKKLIYAYLANSIIYKAERLSKDLKKEYKSELKKMNIEKYIISDSFKRKVRKFFIVIKIKLM